MNKELKEIIMAEKWMSINGPKIDCDTIHPGASCFYQVVVKMSKMYTIMHLFLFFLKFKKLKRDQKLKQGVKRTLKNFVGSLFFMSWLTGGTKTALCFLNRIGFFLDWRATFFLGLGSTSIYFEDSSRRGQIGYFVFVRSLRSLYILLKKRSSLAIKNQKQICFMLIFGMISFLFFDGPKNLKNRYFLEKLWGNA